MAILYSPFKRTILFDPDVLFFKNPSVLWSSRDMARSGTMFFFDRFLPGVTGGVLSCRHIDQLVESSSFRQHFGVPQIEKLHGRHAAYCNGSTSHEQCSSVV